MASSTVQKFINDQRFIQAIQHEKMMKLESQMKFRMVEDIYNQEKKDAENKVQMVDHQIKLIEKEVNQQQAIQKFELSATKKQKMNQIRQLSQKRSTLKANEIEMEEVITTRQFQERIKDLNISAIINQHDQNELQLAKMRLMRYGQTNNKFKKELDSGIITKQYKKNGLINMFNKNIQNSEKLMNQFKEPSFYEGGKESEQRRYQIMKLCNDEGAYLNYKKGEIDLVDKKNSPSQSGSQVYLKYRQILSLENPGEMVTDPALVVNRLYTPAYGTIVKEKRLELNNSDRSRIELEIMQSKKERNLKILEKLKDHMESRERLFQKIQEKNQKSQQHLKSKFSKEGISNIQFDKYQQMLEDTLQKMHEQSLESRKRNRSPNNQLSHDQSHSRYDSQSMKYGESTIPQEKKTLESFRMKLIERKKLRKLEEMKKKRDQKREDGTSSPDCSPTIRNLNKDLQMTSMIYHEQEFINFNDSGMKNISTAMNTNINNVLNSSLQTELMMDSRQFSIVNKLNRTQNEVSVFDTRSSPQNFNATGEKSPNKEKKHKYKVPISQVFKHPNYYVWGDPIHKEDQKQPEKMKQFQQIQQKLQQQLSKKSTEQKKSPVKDQSVRSIGKFYYQNKPDTPQYFTEPYNQKFKPSTPKFKHPRINKYDQDDFWENNDYIDNKSKKYRNNSQVIPEKNKEKQEEYTNEDQKRIKRFIKQCLKNESDEAERKILKSLIYESIRHDKFIEITQFLEDHNDVTAAQLKLFLKKRHSEIEAQRSDIMESVVDHKLGMMDPSRAAASIEKQANIRKNRGKKARYNRLTSII